VRRPASAIARSALRYSLTFVFIVVVLIGGSRVYKEYEDYRRAQGELVTLKDGRQSLEAQFVKLQVEFEARIAGLKAAPVNVLAARIASIDEEVRRLNAEKVTGLARLGLPLASGFVEGIRTDVRIKLLLQEREYLDRLRSTLETIQKESVHLETLRQKHVAAYARLKQNERERAEILREHPLLSRFPGSPPHRKLQDLEEAYGYLYDANAAAHRDYEQQRKVLESLKNGKELFKARTVQLDEVLRPLVQRIDDNEKLLLGNWASNGWGLAKEAFPKALAILLGILLLPVAIKALLYFVLAPIAARRAPVSVLPGGSGVVETASPAGSARSVEVAIEGDEELLVHPAYLQSSPAGASKDTKWLLDWAYPLSSLAAGMVALIRMRAGKPEIVVISATRDPLDEVGMLRVPAGSAVVLHPRNLVAVAYGRQTPLKITTRWRVGSLHAWLTLQLRYVVFHGPARLVVKGCRGVRVEKAGGGRRIDPAATIGFSANLAYSTARSDTFAAYLMGEQPLFVDSFAGSDGACIYEETLRADARTGLFGRGLEGFSDAMLKAFGL